MHVYSKTHNRKNPHQVVPCLEISVSRQQIETWVNFLATCHNRKVKLNFQWIWLYDFQFNYSRENKTGWRNLSLSIDVQYIACFVHHNSHLQDVWQESIWSSVWDNLVNLQCYCSTILNFIRISNIYRDSYVKNMFSRKKYINKSSVKSIKSINI